MAGMRKSILIIEDEATLAEALKRKLEGEDREVLVATGGKDGLAMALQHKPDIILLDLVMPGMGGIDVLANLRRDAWGADAEVIILTNLGEGAGLAEAVKYGIGKDNYLIKAGWELNTLANRIIERLED